jgi:hypothetical protein
MHPGHTYFPVVSFGAATLSWYLEEAFIERKVVTDRVLPALFVALEVWEICRDVRVDL